MKDIILDRLSKVNNINDRRLLKNILYDVFENVVDYNMKMYDRLEKRIYDENPDPLDKFYIYTSLDYISNINPVDDFLHPILTSDLDDVIYNMDEMNEKIKNNDQLILTSVFMKCDNTKIIEILSNKRTYKGVVKTDKDIHEVRITLDLCQKYINEIEKLYKIFQHNSIVWNTVNCPYAFKFLDVILNSSLNLKDGEKVVEISIDLAEYEKYKVINVAPLWNIKEISGEDKSFPMPAIDRINYDHVVSLKEFGLDNGYLVGRDNTDYIYCKRLPEDLVVVSSLDEQHEWNLIQIENFSNNRQKNFSFELVSNKRNLGFIGRYSSIKSTIVRTTGEVARLLQSYDLSSQLILQDFEIKDHYDKEEETMDYNSFIDDNIRVDASKKVMLLKFKPMDRENFLVYDKMSFLVSEIQILFPEYKCLGELI